MDGVDLAALPPKLYGALYKLHQLEHDSGSLLDQLTDYFGGDSWWPWHPVDELPEMFVIHGLTNRSSRRLLVCTDRKDVWMGYCEMEGSVPKWGIFPPMEGRITHWMEIPKPPVSKMGTGEEEG